MSPNPEWSGRLTSEQRRSMWNWQAPRATNSSSEAAVTLLQILDIFFEIIHVRDMDEWIHDEWALVAKNLEDGCQLAMKLLTDASGNPSQIDKDWKDLELIRFVDIKTCIETRWWRTTVINCLPSKRLRSCSLLTVFTHVSWYLFFFLW